MKLDKFKQDKSTAWVWFFLILSNALFAVVYLFMGEYGKFLDSAFVAGVSYWADQLERALTRRNYPEVKDASAKQPE